jgi:hypothetical protein
MDNKDCHISISCLVYNVYNTGILTFSGAQRYAIGKVIRQLTDQDLGQMSKLVVLLQTQDVVHCMGTIKKACTDELLERYEMFSKQ